DISRHVLVLCKLLTRVTQCVVKFLTTEIHCHLKNVYVEDYDRCAVNQWVIKFRDCEPRKTKLVDETHSR
ncbi:hypothetical protein C0J52_24053, partial [Blattella germanica]